MKKQFSISLFIIIGIFISFDAIAQTDTTKGKDEIIINGKHYKAVEEKKEGISKKRVKPLDSVFVIDNKKFKYYNNWLTIGAGPQQNLSYKSGLGFAGGADFNFHIKEHYFQSGILITGEKYNFYTNYQFHLGYGVRLENKDILAASFIGLSYSSGYGMVGDSVYTRPYNHPGLYLQGDIIKKITYDVGIGASLFADWNQEQSIVGLRFILFFSGSYKGKKHVTYEDNY